MMDHKLCATIALNNIVLARAIQLRRRRQKRVRRFWVHPINEQRNQLSEFRLQAELVFHPEQFRSYMRMSPFLFHSLLGLIEHRFVNVFIYYFLLILQKADKNEHTKRHTEICALSKTRDLRTQKIFKLSFL